MNIEPSDFMFPIFGGFFGLMISLWLFLGFGSSISLNLYGFIILVFMLLGSIVGYIIKHSPKTSHTKCNHNWEEHGCAPPIKKYFICTKCGEERLER